MTNILENMQENFHFGFLSNLALNIFFKMNILCLIVIIMGAQFAKNHISEKILADVVTAPEIYLRNEWSKLKSFLILGKLEGLSIQKQIFAISIPSPRKVWVLNLETQQ